MYRLNFKIFKGLHNAFFEEVHCFGREVVLGLFLSINYSFLLMPPQIYQTFNYFIPILVSCLQLILFQPELSQSTPYQLILHL